MRSAAVAGILLLLAAGALAMPENPCTSGWNDTAVHTTIRCDGEVVKKWAMNKVAFVFLAGFPGMFLFFVCPFFFAGRYICQCCGSSRVRPGHFCVGGDYWDGKTDEDRFQAYPTNHLKYVRVAACALIVGPVLYIIMAYVGAVDLLNGVTDIVDGAWDLVSWALGELIKVKEIMENPDGTYPQGLEAFGAKYDEVYDLLNKLKTKYIKNKLIEEFKGVGTGFAFPALIPGGAIVVGAAAAVLRIRQCVPMLVCAVLFFLCGPFGVGSSLMYLATIPIDVACEEAEAQLNKQPGIFQNYLVPNCDETNPIANLNQTLEGMLYDNAGKACRDILSMCDDQPKYAPGSTVYFRCTPPVRLPCRSEPEVLALANSLELKPGSAETCGTNQTNASAPSACTIQECAGACDTATARRLSQDSVVWLSAVARISSAYSATDAFQRWEDCNAFFDHIITKLNICKSLPSGTKLLGSACFFIVIVNFLGIVAMTLGSKRFFDPDKFHSSQAAFGKHHRNLNAATVVSRIPAAPGPMIPVAMGADEEEELLLAPSHHGPDDVVVEPAAAPQDNGSNENDDGIDLNAL